MHMKKKSFNWGFKQSARKLDINGMASSKPAEPWSVPKSIAKYFLYILMWLDVQNRRMQLLLALSLCLYFSKIYNIQKLQLTSGVDQHFFPAASAVTSCMFVLQFCDNLVQGESLPEQNCWCQVDALAIISVSVSVDHDVSPSFTPLVPISILLVHQVK